MIRQRRCDVVMASGLTTAAMNILYGQPYMATLQHIVCSYVPLSTSYRNGKISQLDMG